MGDDLATALTRGWSGDALLAAAIGLLMRAGVWEGPEVRAHEESAARLLRRDHLIAVAGSPAQMTVTTRGLQGQQHLADLRTVPLVRKRRAYRELLLDALYRDRSLTTMFVGTGVVERLVAPNDPAWAQYAGERLNVMRDLIPELDHLVERGLVGVVETLQQATKSSLGQRRRTYRLTSKGMYIVEECGGEMPSGSEQSPDQAPFTVTNTFHGPVTNVHSGMGDLNVGVDTASVLRFAEQLRAFGPSLTFPDEAQRTEYAEIVDELAAERSRGRVATLVQRVWGLVKKAEGPLQEIAVGVIEAELSKVTGTPPGA